MKEDFRKQEKRIKIEENRRLRQTHGDEDQQSLKIGVIIQ